MKPGIAHYIVQKVKNHFVFLFPDIPYWFIVDSLEKKAILQQLFQNIQECGMERGIKNLEAKGLLSQELKDFIETLKRAHVLNPPRKNLTKLAPELPRLAQVSVEVTKACNLACQHCSVAAGIARKDELSLQEIHAFLVEVVRLMKGRKEVVITGGEPFLRPDIFEILNICRNLGFKRILLLTNGTLLTQETGENLGQLNECIEAQNTQEKLVQRLHIQVSIDGIESTHDMIRGRNSWEKAVHGVKILRENNISTNIGMVLNNRNINDVGDVIELAGELGCSVGFSSMVKTGRASQNSIEPVPASRVVPFIRKFIEKDPIYLKYLANFPLSPFIIAFQNLIKFRYCGTGWATVYLDSGGNVYPCQIGATVPEFWTGNIRQTPFSQIWQHSLLLKQLRALHVDTLNEKCSQCEIRYFCGGGCRTEAYLSTSQLNGIDPKCIMGEKKECAWSALRIMIEYPHILEEVSELAIVRLMEDLFEEMGT